MTDYNRTGQPLQGARGVSLKIRKELLLIETAIASKADIAGEIYSGTHDFTAATALAATQALGDSSPKLATTAFVTGTSFSTNLPGQSGNANKFITTNGSVASWGWVLPTQTGNAGKFLATNGASETGESWDYPRSIVRNNQTGAYTALITDRGDLIDWSGSSDNTLSLSACATLANGWYCFARNSGTADLTIDPNGAETIDGLTTFKMYPGESRLIQCDGSVLRSIVLSPFYKVFTSSGTFTKPPGYSYFGGLLWSGGGGGSRNTSTSSSGGGGGGGCVQLIVPSSDVGASETITIGAGGTGRTASTGDGTDGGDSSFGSFITVSGGDGGTNGVGGDGGSIPLLGTSTEPGFLGNSANGGNSVFGGSAGGFGNQLGGDNVYGGAGGGGSSTTPRDGGASYFGGNGGNANNVGTASSGVAPGGGGGSANADNDGGDGARGELRIWGLV